MIPVRTTEPMRRRARARFVPAWRREAETEPRPRGYDRAERQRILAAAAQVSLDQKEHFPFSCFAGAVMLTGLSPHEVLELQWEHSPAEYPLRPWVDLKAWEVVVPAADIHRRHRHVPVVPPLVKLLMQWPQPQKGRLFPEQLTLSQVEAVWAKTRREAGVRPLSLKDLSDTFERMLREDRVVPQKENEERVPRLVAAPYRKGTFPGSRARLR